MWTRPCHTTRGCWQCLRIIDRILEILRPHLEQGRALNVVAREAGVAFRTAQRWVALYRQFGLAALAHKPRADRGGRRALSPELVQVIEGLALERPPRSAAAVYREVCQLAQRKGRKPPSYSLSFT